MFSRAVKLWTVTLCALLPAAAAAQSMSETFAKTQALSDGTTFGDCGQLVARLAGGGSITTGGSRALLTSPAVADGAVLASTHAMPQGPYTVQAKIASYGYHYQPGKAVNFGVVAGLYKIQPKVGAVDVWTGHAVVEVATWDDGEEAGIYVAYWDANGQVHTWNGSSWQPGKKNYLPVDSFHEGVPFTVTFERTTSSMIVQVEQAGKSVIPLPIALADLPQPQTGIYFETGDARHDLGYGTAAVSEIVLPRPASCGATGAPDGGAPIEPQPHSDAGVQADGFWQPNPPAPDGWSWGGFDAGPSGPGAYPSDGGCDCTVGSDAPLHQALPLLLAVGVLVMLRRRRHKS